MMRYGIVDVGSNTIVHVIYETENGRLRIVSHHSDPVHLVSYIRDSHMEPEGIGKACESIRNALSDFHKNDVSLIRGFVTAPARGIDNSDELIRSVRETGLSLQILSGEEEAFYSYRGTCLDTDAESGLMIDIGGGSTELLAFRHHEKTDSFSMPLGCVRLKNETDASKASEEMLKACRIRHPQMQDQDVLLAVGGTARALAKVIRTLYGSGRSRDVSYAYDLYDKLIHNDADAQEAVRNNVGSARRPVFTPGLAMLCAVCRSFGIRTILSSEYGVREGFLLETILPPEDRQIKLIV